MGDGFLDGSGKPAVKGVLCQGVGDGEWVWVELGAGAGEGVLAGDELMAQDGFG